MFTVSQSTSGATPRLAMVLQFEHISSPAALESEPAGGSRRGGSASPTMFPLWCVVPVPDSATSPSLDRPVGAYFSSTEPRRTSSTAVLSAWRNLQHHDDPLKVRFEFDNYPTSAPYPSPVTGSVPVPGGATSVLAGWDNALYIRSATATGWAARWLPLDDGSRQQYHHWQYSISDG